MKFLQVFVAVLFSSLVACQSFPPIPQDLSNVASRAFPEVNISYKQSSVCETTPGVKSFSGYVKIPASYFGYPANYFFWYFQSRKNPETAPLVLWLGGGPGYSSIASALNENGPCNVNGDSNSTTLNPWSWNNEANLLYIDQPNNVGWSYDVLTNGTVDQTSAPLAIQPLQSETVPPANNSFQFGTFGSQSPNTTANTTSNAVRVLYQVTQAWFQDFPEYKLPENRFIIWAESYGGKYGPYFASYIQSQNQKIDQRSPDTKGFVKLPLDTLGLVNGWIDPVSHIKSYPQILSNNTYGLQLLPAQVLEQGQKNVTECVAKVKQCQAIEGQQDPQGFGIDPRVNGPCALALEFCIASVQQPLLVVSNRSLDDIAQIAPDPFPFQFYNGYLNQPQIQADLGSPINFTANSAVSLFAFSQTGDIARKGSLENIAGLLDSGVNVALVYGDRDYQVNWLGGEQASLAINSRSSKQFSAAGYQNITTNSSYVGGLVRQYGNLSFSRVFEAGHQVVAYQPETAYRVFMRVMMGKDVATGTISIQDNGTYSSQGPPSSFQIKNQVPSQLAPICYTWDILSSCLPEQAKAVFEGTALVKDFVVQNGTAGTLASKNSTGSPSSPVAPEKTSGASRNERRQGHLAVWWGAAVVTGMFVMA